MTGMANSQPGAREIPVEGSIAVATKTFEMICTWKTSGNVDEEKALASARSTRRRTKQREGRAKRREARREARGDVEGELETSNVDLASPTLATPEVACRLVEQQITTPKGETKPDWSIIRDTSNCHQNGVRTSGLVVCGKNKAGVDHEGGQPLNPAATDRRRRRPGPRQRTMRFMRDLFESDTRPSDWVLISDQPGEFGAFPDTDRPVPITRLSAIVWEREFMAAHAVERPFTGLREVMRVFEEQAKDIKFFKRQLAKANAMNGQLARRFVNPGQGGLDSTDDYRDLKYAELVLSHLIVVLASKHHDFLVRLEEIRGAHNRHKRAKAAHRHTLDSPAHLDEARQYLMQCLDGRSIIAENEWRS